MSSLPQTTLLLTGQSSSTGTAWSCHDSGQMQSLLAVQILNRKKFFQSQDLLNLFHLLKAMRRVKLHQPRILTKAENINTQLSLEAHAPYPYIMG